MVILAVTQTDWAFTVALVLELLPLAGIVDAVLLPRRRWEAAGGRRWVWLVALVVSLALPFLGALVAIAYLLQGRPPPCPGDQPRPRSPWRPLGTSR
jgi:drug/metabolite transporter (DMT)-like permease